MNSRIIRFALLVHALLFACFSPLVIAKTKSPGAQTAPGVKTPGKSDWREQYAYTLGMQAYVFGFPTCICRPCAGIGSPGPGPQRVAAEIIEQKWAPPPVVQTARDGT